MLSSHSTKILIPSSSNEQGYAFEYLLLQYYQKICRSDVELFSTYKHGKDGKWYQIDGLLVNDKRQLLEAKFYQKPVGCKEIDLDRRLKAARAFECNELLLVSLNGFMDDVKLWAKSSPISTRLVCWHELRENFLKSFSGTFTVLLDQIKLSNTVVESLNDRDSRISFSTDLRSTSIKNFPEFSVYSDDIELWIRRLPKLSEWRRQLRDGRFHYHDDRKTVQLLPHCASVLSIEEAWRIEDAFSGYAARVYGAIKETAASLKLLDGSASAEEIMKKLHTVFQQNREDKKRTGKAGVRSSLKFLLFLGLTEYDSRQKHYNLTPLGWTYVRNIEPDDQVFIQKLNEWLPFRYFRLAVEKHQVPLDKKSIIEWFHLQYAPYEPYARCLFNENKTSGLIELYKRLIL